VTAPLHPLFLKLAGKDVLVVGAGSVAEKKILDLLYAGARVRVVASVASGLVADLAKAGKISLFVRPFAASDVDGAWLVVAASSDPEAQRLAAEVGESRRVFVVAVDDPPHASAYSASVLRRPPFTVAISSSGEAPALSRLLREVLEDALPDDDWIGAARELRARWKSEGTPMSARFGELVRAFSRRADALARAADPPA
jgi:uroporphyrin-III C-methyltransferase/precorrin-2 dehydrogenase/sirohydrochlorin ferrochelatase